MTYTKEQLRDIFRSPFDSEDWKNILLEFFKAGEIRPEPQDLELENTNDKGYYLGKTITPEGLDLGFFYFDIKSGNVLRKRVGLRNLVKPFLTYDVDAVIAVFNDGKHWRLSFITDFGETKTAPKRFTYVFGDSAQYYNTPVKRLFDLQSKDISVKNLYDTFSVEALTKEFYSELSDWYAWATKVMKFPNVLEDDTDDQKYNAENAIRLVTRLIFIWFLKEKKLVPEEFFDVNEVKKLIKDFDPAQKEDGLFGFMSLESTYYQAILQNLFFAMLNCPIKEDGNALRGFRKYDENGKATGTGRGDSRLMRYKDYFSDSDAFLALAQRVPFLNGGLFDCLDDPDNKFYLDGFSDNKEVRKALCVPNFLFFGENSDIDLSEWYDDKQKKHINVRGIIDILKSYQFTIEENTPYEQEVALDPELLGKVFENLLASYNPETKTTARKSTGSYYTPREIVQYMVNESLVAYLKEQVGESLEQQYRQLLDYTDTEGQISLSLEQKKSIMGALYHCKVLDPACGSGAFPMGILQQMVHVLSKLDADNTIWKSVIETKLGQELASTIGHTDEERRDLQNDINRNFDLSQNAPDYARKLYLIENCIYGIDIQTIAIQISKLRCFISLVVDQKVNDSPEDNYGIRPLPNLEARFVAANSLIGLRNDLSLANTEAVQKVREELADANHHIFNAKTLKTKRKWRSKVKDLRDTLVEELKQTGFVTDDDASLIASWDPFNQNCSSRFFDPEWMFGFKKFDIVIGNPPYFQMKKGIVSAKQFPFSEGKDQGKQNIYKIFVELSYNLLKLNGISALITQSSLMCDASAQYTRELLLKYTTLYQVIEFPKIAPHSEGQLFKGALVATCITIFNKSVASPNHKFQLSANNDLTTLYHFDFAELRQSEPMSFYPNGYCLPLIRNNDFPIVEKMNKETAFLKTYISKSSQGDFNLTNEKHCFSTNVSDVKMYRGCHVHRFHIDDNVEEYIQNNYKSNLIDSNEKNRWIVCQNISGMVDKHRFNVAVTNGEKCLFGHSVDKILLESEANTNFILALLNSQIMDWYFRKTSTNNHVNIYELEQLPIPSVDKTQQRPFISLVDRILAAKKANPQADTSEWEKEIDKLVYELYGLTEEEIRIVEGKE